MSVPDALAPGTVIGTSYIVETLVNRGGFGAIYRGVDTGEGNRPCAIKETYDVTPAARRQALMEASVLFTVRSQHLPRIYDVLEAYGRFYIIMQFVEGENLLELLRARVGFQRVGLQEPHQHVPGPFPEQEVLTWLLPILDVLQEMHSRTPAVLHRDIKPANIILTPQQTAVLVDFGLTKLYDPKSTTSSLVQAVSEGFSPPEQYIGQTSPQSDIYAMAATIYLLLTNRLPPVALKRAAQDTLLMPRLLNPALSLPTEQALLKALAVQADQRYACMRDFAQALRTPSLSAYAEPTIAVGLSALPGPQAPLVLPVPTAPGRPIAPPTQSMQTAPPVSPMGVSSPFSPSSSPYPQLPDAPRYKAAAPIAFPPQRQKAKRVDSFGQGCLWGMFQGIVAALLVLLLKEESAFYLGISLGFFVYVMAGFMTTRRGSASWHGAISGYWTGIISTVLFWVALGVGILVLLVQQIQRDTSQAGGSLPPNEIGHAWQLIRPVLPRVMLIQHAQPWVNLLAFLLVGLFLAISLGWLGGIVGVLNVSRK